VATPRAAATANVPQPVCTLFPHRTLGGGYTLTVSGSGYSDATVQRVLNSVTVANLSDPATFYSLQDALG
jgi:hypothetical protein